MSTTGKLFAGLALSLLPLAAHAQSCGGDYTVKRGETLSIIADKLYKDAGKWTAIHNSNISAIGDNPNRIRVGQTFHLPCINGLPTGLSGGTETRAAAAPAAPAPAPSAPAAPTAAPATLGNKLAIKLLTGDDYAPFTEEGGLNGGLVTDVIENAMKVAPAVESYQLAWVNDWSSHLDPLLSNAMLDAGFPWMRPDCDSTPDEYRCMTFNYSDPMFEMLVLLFTAKDRPVAFTQDSDIEGRTLCRPAGYYTHDLNKNGRNWLAEGKITLTQPRTVAECFALLTAGDVDAVALNEFTGRAAVNDLGLKDQVDIVQSRPLSIEGLHAVVAKTHPQSEAMVDAINGGLDAIKANGTYQQIIDVHMSKIWSEL